VDLIDESALHPESAHERRLRDAKALRLRATAQVDSWNTEGHRSDEMVPTLQALEPLAGTTVLELGCGKGIYTFPLTRRAQRLIAVDFSAECLRTVARSVDADAAVGLVQADVAEFVTAPRAFDRVISTLVSNLPTAEMRAQMFRVAAAALRDDGIMVAGVHYFMVGERLRRSPQAGRYNAGGIFRYSYRRREIKRTVARYFAEVQTRPILASVPFASKLPVRVRQHLSQQAIVRHLTAQLLLVVGLRPKRNPGDLGGASNVPPDQV
jgi:SAM-dependent methyltransferase